MLVTGIVFIPDRFAGVNSQVNQCFSLCRAVAMPDTRGNKRPVALLERGIWQTSKLNEACAFRGQQ